jgi:hypothetical protein
LDLTISFGRDDDFSARFSDLRMQMIGVVAFVGDRGDGGEAVKKIMGKSDIVALSRAGDQADRIAERIAGGVDFCA